MSSTQSADSSLLSNLDTQVLTKFDAFPKVPSAYKARSESRGFMTLFVAFLAFLLMLNDIGEYIWGWPDYEFSIDGNKSPYLNINVDLTVNMPCKFLSVDLRDALGDRLYLSGGFRRDGTLFDVSQATSLKEHATALSARQAVTQSRKSRGFFTTLFRKNKAEFKPTYNHQPDASACRIWGTLMVKKVTANLHITTLGHGYASYEHVDHQQMNLSHVISEFSFGPFFPDITQPLDNSFEITEDHFVAYQYFMHVVPTTYIAPRSYPLQTHQYSVTHYTRVLEHNQNTPGIFFKFDLDPLSITLHQRTTTFVQLFIRCVGVIGGVFVCMGYAIKITTRAVEVVSGADQAPGIVAAEASGAKAGLRAKWGGGDLRSRTTSGRMVRQGSGWVMEGNGGHSGYSSYAGTPATAAFPQSPFLPSPSVFTSNPSTPNPQSSGFPTSASTFGPGPAVPPTPSNVRSPSGLGPPRTPSLHSAHSPSPPVPSAPGTPAYATFPPSPNPVNGGGFSVGVPPRKVSPKKDD
ncbi:DUF1692-domain-containing protein [Crucibulum laeve]|uniref:DUF1692-domain-containing protein n=1 Tax=Crucibulum laeve TaxID=68775 RepID=A0A5C3LNP7_9AGAR|nr:DUF1692-domain-containing protein [Crucibulum laeve]